MIDLLLDREFNNSRKCLEVLIREYIRLLHTIHGSCIQYIPRLSQVIREIHMSGHVEVLHKAIGLRRLT